MTQTLQCCNYLEPSNYGVFARRAFARSHLTHLKRCAFSQSVFVCMQWVGRRVRGLVRQKPPFNRFRDKDVRPPSLHTSWPLMMRVFAPY